MTRTSDRGEKWRETRNLATDFAMVGGRARDLYDEAAKERMKEGGKAVGKGQPQQGMENLPHPLDDSGKSRDKAGKGKNACGSFATSDCGLGPVDLPEAHGNRS